MNRRVYAEHTKVPTAQIRAQIETMDEPSEAVVAFMFAGHLIRLRIEIPVDATDQQRRAIGLVVKAKIEAVAQGISTVEQEWLAHIVLPDGSTVGDWIEPQLQVAYDQGRMPTNPLLLEGPR
ncbi:hypothetical protein [Methylobacterium brachiatum]|uniref:hypothetical protein n=1 Tax=Methylobacterium brachiatum TaxID=269660 RepID=UPI0024484F47|nr:hypothetical protein [Methylobacterium brachiatum]MDH2310381.1 hypothetical protein [Methylobacterium brachiatum]